MSKWISGKDLIEGMGLDAFELLKLVIKGLQPHDQSYIPIPPPDTQEKQTELRELREELKVWNSRCSSGGRLTYQEYMGPYSNLKLPKQKGPILSTHGSNSDRVEYLERGIKRIEAKIKILKGELQTLNTVSWTKYELSDDNATVEAVIAYLKNSKFKLSEVERVVKPREFGQIRKTDIQKVFPCQPGNKWDDIKITLIGDDKVKIKTPQGEDIFSYHQIGMSDKATRDRRPTVLWEFVKILAKNDGFISSKNPDYNPKFPDTAKRLNKHLKQLFGIDDSIYQGHYKKMKGYKTKIFFSDRTKVVS